jgi:hypothetical protein
MVWIGHLKTGTQVYSLITAGQNLFAGTYYGVYLSTNNGTSWLSRGLQGKYINTLAFSGGKLIAGTNYSGVYISPDNGLNWTDSALAGEAVNQFVVSGSNIYAATDNEGILLSTNNGFNWQSLGLTNANPVYTIAVSGSYIYAGSYAGIGVHLSTNNGLNWIEVNNGITNKSIRSLAISGQYVFAGSMNGIFLTSNNGLNWISKNQGFTGSFTSVYSILILNDYIYAGTQNSVWKRLFSDIIDVKNINESIPDKYSLYQNYPNPFNPVTRIKFDIPPAPLQRGDKAGMSVLKVYDILGKEIETLVNEKLQPGTYEVTFNASQYPSGVYFYRLQVGDYNETKRMLLIK